MELNKFIEKNYDMVMKIINRMEVGIWITDGDGHVLMINDRSAETGGLKREELIGRKMEDLLNMGYILGESSVINAMKSEDKESVVQGLGEGGYVMATSVPIYENNKLSLVICTERNITEIIKLKELLKEQEKKTGEYQNVLQNLQKQDYKGENEIIAASRNMVGVIEDSLRAAKLDTTVMISGESGTGKEMIAKLIYENSQRRDKPFIKVNCAAIPESLMESEFFGYEDGAFTGAAKGGKIGFFEMANGGTLFLDEISSMPLYMQPKLLRVLQEMEIMRVGGDKSIPLDVRIISAINTDLRKAVADKLFREDLYYRLNVVPIEIPPLRDRSEDIPLLAKEFVSEFNMKYKLNKNLTAGAITSLKDYEWPGNVRELRNIIERIMVESRGNDITSFHVILQLSKTDGNIENAKRGYENKSLREIEDDFEKSLLKEFYAEKGNMANVAKALRVDKSTITRKFRKHGIKPEL